MIELVYSYTLRAARLGYIQALRVMSFGWHGAEYSTSQGQNNILLGRFGLRCHLQATWICRPNMVVQA